MVNTISFEAVRCKARGICIRQNKEPRALRGCLKCTTQRLTGRLRPSFHGTIDLMGTLDSVGEHCFADGREFFFYIQKRFAKRGSRRQLWTTSRRSEDVGDELLAAH